MDLKYIEKRIFIYILLVSCFVALIVSSVNSLLTLSNLYFLGMGYSQQQLALINVAIVGGLVAINAAVIGACLRGFFQTRRKSLTLDAIPKIVTTCVSEFIQGYKGHEA